MNTDKAIAVVAWTWCFALLAYFGDAIGALSAWRSSQNFAAELQAYGGLLALGIAIWVPAIQRRHERRERKARRRERSVEQLHILYFITESLDHFVRDLLDLAAKDEATRANAEADTILQADILSRLAAVETYEVGFGHNSRVTAYSVRRILRLAVRSCTVDGRAIRYLASDSAPAIELQREATLLWREAAKVHSEARDTYLREMGHEA